MCSYRTFLSVVVRFDARHKKKRGIAVVHSTYRGSSITYCCWTDNVRAHADMNIVPQSLTDRHSSCSLSAKGMRINTSRGRLRCYVQDNNVIVDLLDFRYVHEQSVVNAFLCNDSFPTSCGHTFCVIQTPFSLPMLPASVGLYVSVFSSLGSA